MNSKQISTENKFLCIATCNLYSHLGREPWLWHPYLHPLGKRCYIDDAQAGEFRCATITDIVFLFRGLLSAHARRTLASFIAPISFIRIDEIVWMHQLRRGLCTFFYLFARNLEACWMQSSKRRRRIVLIFCIKAGRPPFIGCWLDYSNWGYRIDDNTGFAFEAFPLCNRRWTFKTWQLSFSRKFHDVERRKWGKYRQV